MESNTLLIILIGIIVIAVVSKRIRGTIITLPMLYTLFGLLIAVVFRDMVRLTYDNPFVEVVANLTLVLVLASDSSRIQLKNLLRFHQLPLRMLLFALPLTFLLGTLVGVILFNQMNIWVLAILAVTLAPIDSSLAESSVDNPSVPVRIRQALNVEGGMDDGITLPFLLLFISLAVSQETGVGVGIFMKFVGLNIVFGILAGVIMGYLGSRYISWGQSSGWMSSQFQKIGWLALVLITYGLAEAVGGNGFIAAFLFGIISGNLIDKQESESLYRYAEVENTLLMLLTFVFYGAVMLYPALQQLNITILIYALLTLTVVRMLPIAISLIGTKLRFESMLYLGWFGPVGIGSILYVYTILGAENIPGQDMVFNTVMFTIFLSVLVHGMSAAPISDWYAKRIARLDKAGLAETETFPIPEMSTRKGSESATTIQSQAAGTSK